MDKELKILLAVVSITVVLTVIIWLWLSGADISGIELHKGIRFG